MTIFSPIVALLFFMKISESRIFIKAVIAEGFTFQSKKNVTLAAKTVFIISCSKAFKIVLTPTGLCYIELTVRISLE